MHAITISMQVVSCVFLTSSSQIAPRFTAGEMGARPHQRLLFMTCTSYQMWNMWSGEERNFIWTRAYENLAHFAVSIPCLKSNPDSVGGHVPHINGNLAFDLPFRPLAFPYCCCAREVISGEAFFPFFAHFGEAFHSQFWRIHSHQPGYTRLLEKGLYAFNFLEAFLDGAFLVRRGRK